MGAENPLDELKKLDRQVDLATSVDDLKPIFTRVDQIAKENADDFEVQLVAGDIKQHLVNRGNRLKAQQAPLPQPPTIRLTPGASTPPTAPPSGLGAVPPIPSAPPQASTPEPPPTIKLTPSATPPPVPPAAQPPKPEPSPPIKPAASSASSQAPKPEPPPGAPSEPRATMKLTSSGQFAKPSDLPKVAPPPVPPGSSAAGQPPQPPAEPPQQPPPPPVNWKRPLILGALLGAVISIALIAFLVNQARKRNLQSGGGTSLVQVDVTTTPPYAQIRLNNETKCMSPCKVPLAPGVYQLMAFLDGYEPAAAPVSVVAGAPASVNIALTPQAQTFRILSDLDQGKVVIDDQPPADLQEGQYVIEKIAPGTHTVKVTGKNNTEAIFSFEIADAKPPAITGTVSARNLVAVLIASLGSKARVVTNSGPMKLVVNGTPEDNAGPAGVDLKSFQPGVDEIVVGEGNSARNMKESFGPQPMLTAFLKSDINMGTLIVSTGEDDVRVFLNNKEYRRRTQHGQVRIPAIGPVSVRVEKSGFDGGPVQTAEVKKGSEVRLEFKMKALPQTATLQISGGTPGAEVLIDQRSVGTIGPDGNFAHNGIQPGDHTIDLRRDQFTPKRLTRNFRAGQSVALSGPEAVLAAAISNGTVRLARIPPDARVTYRRADESQTHDALANQIEIPAGAYIFSASAPGYQSKTERVQIAAGETRTLDLALARAASAPVLKPGDITGFEDASAWRREGELWIHRGGGFIPYALGPKGVYTFTVELLRGGNLFRGGRIRWCVQYTDAKNYQLFELDHKNFWAEVVEKGKKYERNKVQHDLEKQRAYTIQLEITQEHVVHKLRNPGGDWITLDSFAEPGRNPASGKFGFLIQGNDEIGVSSFTFQPK